VTTYNVTVNQTWGKSGSVPAPSNGDEYDISQGITLTAGGGTSNSFAVNGSDSIDPCGGYTPYFTTSTGGVLDMASKNLTGSQLTVTNGIVQNVQNYNAAATISLNNATFFINKDFTKGLSVRPGGLRVARIG